MTDFLELLEKLKNVLYESTPDYFINYYICREGDLSEQYINIPHFNNRFDVEANNEDMANLDKNCYFCSQRFG